MKLIKFFFIFLIFFPSCKKSTVSDTFFADNYGQGMYIVTDLGISYYNFEDTSDIIQENIFNLSNNIIINNPKKIKFKEEDAYIIANNSIIKANVNTFERLVTINGFFDPVDIDFVSQDRLFVADYGDSKVKEVDLSLMEITSDIETGDSTRPVFLVSNSYKTFVLNGGDLTKQLKDSTLVVINYQDGVVPIANFAGSLNIGDNPNSAVIFSNGFLYVLNKGVYDPSNSLSNTEASLSFINQYTNEVYSTDKLSGIFNAQNLISSWNNSKCYFTANDGIYELSPDNLNTNLIISTNSSIIASRSEFFTLNDTTIVSYEMMYMNNNNLPNIIYKYNIDLSLFVDTFSFNGNIRDIAFY